jgi:hypothetical protein
MYSNTYLFIFTFLHVLVTISSKLIQCAYYIRSTGKKKLYVRPCSKIYILQFIVIMVFFFYIGITFNFRYSNLVA